MAKSKFNFGRVIENMRRVKKELPITLANDIKNDFLMNFRNQGFEGQKWKEVQRRIPGTKAYNGKKDPGKRTRNILQGKGSGRLRKDVANSIKEATWDRILLQVNNPYGQVHNEGLRAGRGAGFVMPKRQFAGDSPRLRRKIKDKMIKVIDDIWKV